MSQRLEERVWLIRHGETEWSPLRRHTGRRDLPLTARGEDEARAVGRHLGGRRFARVLVSPLERARASCRLAGYADAAVVEPDLVEWDYGAYEGRTPAEIRAEVSNWNIWTHGVPGGETVADVARRARRVVSALREADGPVALFAHGHLLRILAALWLELDPGAARGLALETGCISTLGYERGVPAIVRWNLPAC
jgi:probable phosphoglycerate mutase